jgi:multisubunit Na+/H+ antiporter MnhB subunit
MNLLKLYRVVVGILVLAVFFTLLLAVEELPPYGGAENPTVNEVYDTYVHREVEDCKAYNLVSNIILDYRAYDTLLETTSLFAVVMGIILMWGTGREQQ